MIKIGNPEITLSCGLAKLSAKIYADGDEHELWLSVDSRYARFLCAERSDAFLLALLPYAFISGHDIECVAPVTERLYRQLVEQFLPAFYKINGYSRDERHAAGFAVNVVAELADEVEHPTNGNQVGTGCSCGVDSMHVYAVNTDLTLACLWNVHGVTADETQGKREVGWRNLVRQAKAFTNSIGKELLIADTNFDRGCFPELRWDGMTPYPDSTMNIAVLGNGNTAQGVFHFLSKFTDNIRMFYRKTISEFKEQIGTFDVIVNGIEVDRPDYHLISKKEIEQTKPGCFFIDAAADAGNTIEGTKYTSIDQPMYEEGGRIFYEVNNSPSIIYRTASRFLSKAFAETVFKPGVSRFWDVE